MKKKCLPIAILALAFALPGCGREDQTSSVKPSDTVETPDSSVNGNGSGNDPIKQEYSITSDASNVGGTLTFSKDQAKEGETITINVEMEEGYFFVGVSISGLSIKTVEEGKTYTFTMPGHDVVVKLNVNEMGKLVSFYDTKTVGINMNLELGLESRPGTFQELILNSTEVPFTSLFEEFVVMVGGSTYELDYTNDECTEAKVNYRVPEGEYAIYFLPLLDIAKDTGGNSISFEKEDNVNVYGLEHTSGLDLSGVYFYLDGGMDYNITNISYKYEGDADFIPFTERTGMVFQFGSLTQVMFWEPESENMKDVIFHVEGKQDTLKDIIYTSTPDLGGISSLPQKAFGGSPVFFSLQGITEAAGYSTDDYAITDDNGAEVATERGYGQDIVSFNMPDSNAHFNFINNKMPTLSFNPVEGLTDVAFYNESDFRHANRVYAVKAGKRFVAVPELADGYGILKCDMDGQEISKSSDGTFVATMPDHDVVLTFTVAATHTVTINTVENGSGIILFGKTTASVGETVKVSFSPKDDSYILDRVTCDGHPELDIAINGKIASFVMPDYDVVLTPVFKYNAPLITVTVSLLGTQDIVGDYTFTGKVSGKTISKLAFSNNNQNKMYAGEAIDATIKLIDATKIVSLMIGDTTYPGVEAELDTTDKSPDGDQYYTFNFEGITLPDAPCTISFVFTDRPASEVTE